RACVAVLLRPSHDCLAVCLSFCFFPYPSPAEFYTLSLHDALPITIPHMVVHDLAGSGSGEQAGAPDIGALPVDPDRGSRLAGADGQDRYLRQMRLPQLGAQGQRRLAAARVAVIGAGGLGAPVLTYLAAAGIGEINLIDPDVVDRTNLHRQVIFESKDAGRSKAV